MEWFQEAVERLQNVVFFASCTGTITYINSAVHTLLGYHPEEIIGHELQSFVTFDNYSLSNISELVVQKEVKWKTLDGTLRPVILFLSLIAINGKEQIQGEVKDNSIEAEKEEWKEKYEELFQSIPCSVAVYERVECGEKHDFVFKRLNQSAVVSEKIEELDMIIGRKVTEMFPGVIEFGLFDVFERVYQTGKPELHPLAHYIDGRLSGWKRNYVFKSTTKEVIAVFEDITGLELYKSLFHHSPMGVLVFDNSKRYRHFNKRATCVTGYSEEELLKMSISDCFVQCDPFDELFESTVPSSFEVQLRRKDGEVRWVSVDAVKLTPHAVMSIIVDITEKKQANEVAEKARRRYRTLFESLGDPTLLVEGKEGVIVDANEAVLELWGISCSELIGMKWSDTPHSHRNGADLSPSFLSHCTNSSVKSEHLQTSDRNGNSLYVLLNVSAVEMEDVGKCYIVSYRDITGRIVAEERFKTVSDISSDLIFEWDREKEDLCWYGVEQQNGSYFTLPAVEEHLPETMRDFLDAIHPDDRNGMILDIITGCRFDRLSMQFRVRRNGSYRIWEVRAAYTMEKWIGSCLDVTEKKLALEEATGTRALFKTVVSQNPLPTVVVDKNGELVLENEAFLSLTNGGTSVSETWRFSEDENREHEYKPLRMSVTAGQIISNKILRLEIKDGNDRVVSFSSAPVYNERTGDIIAGISAFADITEQRKAEEDRKEILEKVHQSQKMESLGRLAGGVAHDFNNLLAGIIGNAEHVHFVSSGVAFGKNEELSKEMKEITSCVKDVLINAHRGRRTVSQLMSFSRWKSKPECESVDLHRTIESVVGVLRVTARHLVVLRTELLANVATVNGDETQMENAILNLGINAFDALGPDKQGEVLFRTRDAFVRGEKYLRIEVEDNGCGVPSHVKDRIFEPFFTTKEPGKGTGLGLSTVYGMVVDHNGEIHVESEIGKFTRFVILLPQVRTPSSVKASVVDPKVELKMEKREILIVDDEPIILRIGKRHLERMGHVVHAASGGHEAMEIFKEKLNEIDLVILDMCMPDMGGQAVFDAMKSIRADVKVMISSGFRNSEEVKAMLRRGAMGELPKPFTYQELRKALSCLLTDSVVE